MRITLLLLLCLLPGQSALAHPLGQFSVNHYARIIMVGSGVEVRYVIDLAELPAFREAQIADTDGSGSLSPAEMDTYLDSVAPGYLAGLSLTADGQPLTLTMKSKQGALLPGQTGSDAMGLATMRMILDLEAALAWTASPRKFQFEDRNQIDKPGWRELVVNAREGLSVFNSTAAGNGITEELAAYPESLLNAPLNEPSGEWMATSGEIPVGVRSLALRNGQPAAPSRDRFLALITVPRLTPGIILLGLIIAFALGAVHALSPGHGKALVGAYLVGSRGTPRHAAFLGLTVTISHTLTVYLGGIAFLLASKYVLPERLYPLLSFISGAMIMVIGAGLLMRRIRWSSNVLAHTYEHLLHDHEHAPHTHGHLPAGEKLTWRNLLALGISGGIIPCPSAWILMLGAISLNRTAYGLALIFAFSLGLACVLTLVGVLFVYGGRFLEKLPGSGGILKVLPVLSSLVITILGGAIAYQALLQAGLDPAQFWRAEIETTATGSAAAILGLGLVIGLRHALDTDHLAAVSAIVCERKSIFSSLLIGGLWGIGHTISLLVAGVGVIMLHIKIEKYEKVLEFCVALMLIGLGLNVLFHVLRDRRLHSHPHRHGEKVHEHLHLHHEEELAKGASRAFGGMSIRPLLIGMVHGLAGSAALMLGVLATIDSTPLAFAYIVIFGIGSIGGMMVMSVILGLPAHFTAESFTRANVAIRAVSGMFSLGFGAWLVYEIGFVEGLFR